MATEDLLVTVHSTGKIFSDACGAVIREGFQDGDIHVPTIWATVEVRPSSSIPRGELCLLVVHAYTAFLHNFWPTQRGFSIQFLVYQSF